MEKHYIDHKRVVAALMRANAAINWCFGAMEAMEKKPDLSYLAEVVSDLNTVLADAYGVDVETSR